LEDVQVVAQHVGVHRGHASCPGAVEEGRSQPGSDASAPPCVVYQDGQIRRSRGSDAKIGDADAGCAAPRKPRLVDRSIPKQAGVVGPTIREPVKAVEQGVTRAAGQHGQDSLEV
jgi:hypothetical protein